MLIPAFEEQKKKELQEDLNKDFIKVLWENETEKAKSLLENGADPNYLQYGSVRPLSVSILMNNTAMLHELIKHNADIKEKNGSETGYGVESQLVFAINRGSKEMVELLLRSEPEYNVIEKDLMRGIFGYQVATNAESLLDHRMVATHKLGIPKVHEHFDCEQNRSSATAKIPSSLKPRLFEGRACFAVSEGMNDRSSLPLIYQSLVSYADSDIPDEKEKELFKEVSSIFGETNDILKLDSKKWPEEFLKSINEGMPTIIPAGWKEHSLTLIVWGNYLLVSNKGESREILGPLTVYKLKNKLTKEQLEVIIDINEHSKPKEALIEHMLNLIDEKVIVLPAHSQKYGTCSYTNKKSAVKGLIFLKKMKEGDHWRDPDISNILKEVDSAYKKFTAYDRDTYIKSIIHIANMLDEQDEKNILLELIGLYMVWHSDEISKFNNMKDYISLLSKENKIALLSLINQPEREVKSPQSLTPDALVEHIHREIFYTAATFSFSGVTAIDRALHNNDVEYIQFLIKIMHKEIDITSVLNKAICQRKNEIARCIISEYPDSINSIDRRRPTPLLEAIYSNNTDIVKALLEVGAKIDIPNSELVLSPIKEALESENCLLLKLFIDQNCLSEMTTQEKQAALELLIRAADTSYDEVVSKLLSSMKKERLATI